LLGGPELAGLVVLDVPPWESTSHDLRPLSISRLLPPSGATHFDGAEPGHNSILAAQGAFFAASGSPRRKTGRKNPHRVRSAEIWSAAQWQRLRETIPGRVSGF
jgi:hypothetical protein